MKTNQEEPKKTKGWWSFILGVLGFIFGGPFTGIPAIILGHKQMKEYACWQANVGRILGIITTVLGIGFGIFFLALLPEGERPLPFVPSAPPKISIGEFSYSVHEAAIDKLYLDKMNVVLRNEGKTSVGITKVTFSSNGDIIEGRHFGTIKAGEQQSISFLPTFGDRELSKPIGIQQIEATIRVFGYGLRQAEKPEDQILAEKNIVIGVPTAKVGDVIPARGKHDLSLTLLWVKESEMGVMQQSENEYYTLTAKPDMKFVILAYKFTNNWIREQETPCLSIGEIATDKGLIYRNVSGGVASLKDYSPRKSTKEEIGEFIGDSGGYEHLLPGESTTGRILFEIPKGATPTEAGIYEEYIIAF